MPVVGYRFSFDCSSHVRLHLQFYLTVIFGNQMLINAASIAIWNRKRAVVALAMTILGTSIGFHFDSEYLSPLKTWNLMK